MNKINNTEVKQHWLFGALPGSIEAQEKEGQRQLAASNQLPKKGNCNYKEVEAKPIYEAMGIKVLGDSAGDPLFVDVELPEGWKIQPTGHDMWSYLLDQNGHKRAGIFYKAAFYDRRADVTFEPRYVAKQEYFEKEANGNTSTRIVHVWDNKESKSLYQTEKHGYSDSEKHWEAAKQWLQEHFPEHSDPLAYWDKE